MKKIAFVIPWFGENIPGGAESLCKETAIRLKDKGLTVEILTTCIKDFRSDWNVNYWKEGTFQELGLVVRRFKVEKKDHMLFNHLNEKLINKIIPLPIEQQAFMENMFKCPSLIQYIAHNHNEYHYFFLPYMFPSTYYGVLAAAGQSHLIPCLHNESYAYLPFYQHMFASARKILFLSSSEAELAQKLYNLNPQKIIITGAGVDTTFTCEKKDSPPYILYVGRKDPSKNTPLLLEYFIKYKKSTNNKLQLILIGPGDITFPHNSSITDHGFTTSEEKYNYMANALFLCQPSTNESFSLAIMESWLCERPVLVHGNCNATTEHCKNSNGGLWFDSYLSFESCCNYFLNQKINGSIMGKQGKNYVLQNYTWEKVISKYMEVIADAN